MIKRFIKKIIPEKVRLDLHYLFFKFKAIFYKGNNVYCNCCNKNFDHFLPYGNKERNNAVCPYCHSLERTRLLMYFLNNETSVFSTPNKLLHFAPERAIETNLKKLKNLNYITADINPAFADYEVDIQDIPFHDNKFDIIICSHVLGHIPNEAKAIDEIFRVLKPGGFALILTLIDFNRAKTFESAEVNSNEKRLEQYGEPDLLRLHGNDFAERLNRKNIDIETVKYFKNFSIEERQRYQLGTGERELIFKCIKIE